MIKKQLKANKWHFRKQTVNAADIPHNAIIYVTPDTEEENYKAFVLSNITCVKLEKDKLTFKAKKKPHIDINVMIHYLRFK